MGRSPLATPASLLLAGVAIGLGGLVLLLVGSESLARWLGPAGLAIIAVGALGLERVLRDAGPTLLAVPHDTPARRAGLLAWVAGAGAVCASLSWSFPAAFAPIRSGVLGVLLLTLAVTGASLTIPLLLWTLDGVWLSLGETRPTGPLIVAGVLIGLLLAILLVRGVLIFPVPAWLVLGLGALVPGLLALPPLARLRSFQIDHGPPPAGG